MNEDESITLEYYLFLLESGIPYNGMARSIDGIIFRSICVPYSVPPESLYIANPSRFADYDQDTFSVLTESTLYFFPEDNKLNKSESESEIKARAITNMLNGTISVDLGDGNIVYLPAGNCEIRVEASEYSSVYSAPTVTIRIKDNSTGNTWEKTRTLEEAGYIYGIGSSNRTSIAMTSEGARGNYSSNWIGIAKTVNTFAGFAVSALELGAGKSTFRIYKGKKFSPKLYRRSPKSKKRPYYGGGRGHIKTYSAAKLLKTAGKRIFIIGALFELIDAYQKGQSWGKAFVNTTVALGCFSIGGVPGLIIGIAYFGLDTLGAFDGPDFDKGVFEPTSDPFQPYYSPADNTRVLLPCIPPELIRNADGFNASHIDSTKLQRLLLDE